MKELRQAVRQQLAWESIWNDRETLNLDQFQMKQAETKRTASDETVDVRIPECYQWLLVPGQSDPKGSVEWTEIRLQGQESLAARAVKKLKNDEHLILNYGGIRLRQELDRIPLWRGNHIGIKQLAEDMARYLYLPRLRDEDVLLGAIVEGLSRLTWKTETFAYSESWNEKRQRYQGLKAGEATRVLLDGQTLLVKPEVAIAQMEAEAPPATTTGPAITSGGLPGSGSSSRPAAGGSPIPTTPAPAKQLRRFFGTVHIDPMRLGRDASTIAEEVVQHLTRIVGAEVEITLEVRAELPAGAADKLVRDVTENCRTLKFENYGFEEV